MQHLDEGTIHSWLDGALSGDEAARVDAHVKECPECAAVVAEARGFIAASSRILTALDNAPRGVIPAAAPKKRIDPFVWRVAATVMIVAAGSLVVFRNSGREVRMTVAPSDTAANTLQAIAPGADGGEARGTTPEPAPPIAMQANPSRRILSDNSQPSVASAEQSATKTVASSAPAIALSKKTDAEKRSVNDAVESRVMTGRAAGVAQQNAAAGYVGGVAPTTPEIALSPAGAVAMDMDAGAEPERLKVVGRPRAPGVNITLYEVAGDTVTLTEPIAAALSAVVTAAPSAPLMRAREKAAAPPAAVRVDAATAAIPDSQSAGAVQSARAPKRATSVPAPVRQVEVANGVTTISWTDAATGNVLKLSGRVPAPRLQQIKIRIERERAAAVKKTP